MAPKKIKKNDTPKWIVTFADLSTLLLTFFVLMLSFANTDIVKFREMLGSVQNAFGVQFKAKGDYQPTLQGQPGKSGTGKSLETLKSEADMEHVKQTVNKLARENSQSNNIEVIHAENSIIIRVKGHLLFPPGKAELSEQSFSLLDGIAKILSKYPYKLSIEGHTDNIPISTPAFPSNWELSSIRATRVLRYLIYRNVNPKRLSAIGYADNKPITSNSTAQGRALNRRVEFVLTKGL